MELARIKEKPIWKECEEIEERMMKSGIPMEIDIKDFLNNLYSTFGLGYIKDNIPEYELPD
ncbi:MAG: hypothetical protein LBV53_02420 [Mycoplasmataceae bacterium]|jgi:hypothetical protein|nr:hypothetical protein [Mycoplasmataceae bacterium]